MDKVLCYLLTLIAGCFGMSAFATLMIAVCGRYNQQCGGTLQFWQAASMVVIGLAPSAIFWCMTRKT